MSRYSLFVGALCVLGCFARPHGGSSEQQDGPQGMMRGGSMMGGPMMAKVMAAMANNPFLSDLSDEQRAAFFAIKMNTTLTKGQIVSAVNEFLQSLSADIKNDYTVWQANVTQWKTNMINKIKSSVSPDAQAVIDKIQGIMEDQSLTYKDTCHGVLDAVNETSSAVKDELKAAAKANFGDALQAKMGARMGNGNGNAQVGGSAQGPQGGAVVNMRGGAGVGAAGNGNPSMGAPGMGGPGMGRPGMGGPGMGGPGMGGPGMGGPGMGGPGMPGMRGDPCEMMENIVEHLGKMASMMHGVDDDDNNEDVAAAVPAAPAS